MVNHTPILAELANLNPPQTEFNNQRILRALAFIGNPQFSYPVIHIAGSNGKGSTAAFIATGLAFAGYKVAKYSSPYIQCLNECITINQKRITDKQLAELYLEFKPQLLAAKIYLSSFEMLSLLMFVYFAQQKIDYLVLETGLGGRDDATNVVKSLYSVITNISLEHTQWLGNSLAEIAEHKAGIIQQGKVVLADTCSELLAAVASRTAHYCNVLSKYCYSSRLDLTSFTTQVTFSLAAPNSAADKAVILPAQAAKQVKLSLFGHFQARNFLAAYEVLSDLGLSDELIFAAAAKTCWPGRLELLSRYPRIVADASHNPDGCKNLYASLNGLFPAKDVVIICSILADKNQSEMLNWYAKIGQQIILCNLSHQARAVPARQLARLAAGKFKNVYVLNSPELALRVAKSLRPQLILISGSSYLLKNYLLDTGKYNV